MRQIGYLGDILFEVGMDKLISPYNIQWSGSTRYATHLRHVNNALTEFMGVDPDKMSFEIHLSADLGIDVMTELGKIWAYERNGKQLSLVIGEKIYGKYRWTIQRHTIKMQYFDRDGNLIVADVSLNLLEYIHINM